MKRTKKILSLALCAVLLVAATVATTVAYLTDDASVTNTFTVGNVDISLDETNVDQDKVGDMVPERDQANDYKLLPGQTYVKDPTIHVSSEDNIEDCYLFVKVTDEIVAIQGEIKVADQMLANGWERLSSVSDVWYWTADENVAAITEELEVVTKGTNVPVFDNFTIASNVDNDMLADYVGKQIIVKAYAIQVAGFEDMTPAQIWSAAAFE